MSARTGPRVVVVTGGGGGIGAAVAEELGGRGDMVVTVDPLVTLDGADRLPAAEETTADRIVAAGGSARSSSASVTDADAITDLFTGLVDEFGRLDAVVNVAGISRPTSFATGAEEDWQAVLSVHLDGYLNVLRAALPLMAAAGRGRILGVTSGSGWRAANAGAYGCAKRAVAALTWELGRHTPPGIVVNAMSPIAVTRMVTEALARAQRARGGGSAPSASGGLSLGSMPAPEQLAPTAAHLVSEHIGWCRGQVVFVGGPEVAVVEEPRLLEVVRTDGVDVLPHLLETVTGAWAAVEGQQATTGAGNPRFGSIFDGPLGGEVAPTATRTCAVVTDRRDLGAAVVGALEARGVASHLIELGGRPRGFPGAAELLASAVERLGPLDAVVLAPGGAASGDGRLTEWERVLSEHVGIVAHLHDDAGWARAVADHTAATEHPVRLVTLIDATTAGGRSRAQASAQLARASQGATADRVAAFAVSVETDRPDDHATVAEVTALLACSPESLPLVGAELVVGPGWVGLRSHPRPSGSVVFGGPAVPSWLDDVLRQIVAVPPIPNEETG
jgi:NAD(P)-dependent dehydrogenase (short-subunit alcohol dehydrogenase family)